MDDLRKAFGSFMTGVTVVTATGANDTPVGFTANSFTSVSMDPPLLLVCPGKHLGSYDVFNTTTHFAVSVLAEGQEAISNNFASGPEDRFASVDWKPDDFGSALIEGACATFSCRVHQRHVAGDHLVLIGEIIQFKHYQRDGLGYGNNGYFSLSKEQQSDTTSLSHVTGISGAIIKYDDQILVLEDTGRLSLPVCEQDNSQGPRSALQQYFEKLGLKVSLGPVYSIYDDKNGNKRFTFFLGNASSDTAGNLGQFQSITGLNTSAFNDKAQATMLKRFVTEMRNQVFGLYIGDVDSGDVHHPENNQS